MDWFRLMETSMIGALFFYHMYAIGPKLDRIALGIERLLGDRKV